MTDAPTAEAGEAAPDRSVWSLTGRDALPFLQGLVSNDVLPLGRGPGIVWAALLTPQGKYLADFFVIRRTGDPEGSYLIDIATPLAEATLRRLMMYRLRAAVTLAPVALHVRRGLGPAPEDALPDPRHPDLGWRAWTDTPGTGPMIDWEAIRVRHLIPESGIELIPDETYLLEAGFERLHGVDFRKGCYVGQEVTARMKHKTELRKGLLRVRLSGTAPVGTTIMAADREVGTLFTQIGSHGIAYLRHDRIAPVMRAGDATVFPAD